MEGCRNRIVVVEEEGWIQRRDCDAPTMSENKRSPKWLLGSIRDLEFGCGYQDRRAGKKGSMG